MRHPVRDESGFSLVEIVVVVGLIGAMVAIAVPNIAGFLKNYQIKAASRLVATEISSARTRAIMKNVNRGVTLVALSNTTFRFVNEDIAVADSATCNPGPGFRTASVNDILGDAANCAAQIGTLRDLPEGVVFDPTFGSFECPTPPAVGGALDSGMRFRRLGDWCDPGTVNCPAVGGGANMFWNSTGGTDICLRHTRTGARKLIRVAPGGRVMTR
jgi:type II secretory pathway pseudopilin PulG